MTDWMNESVTRMFVEQPRLHRVCSLWAWNWNTCLNCICLFKFLLLPYCKVLERGSGSKVNISVRDILCLSINLSIFSTICSNYTIKTGRVLTSPVTKFPRADPPTSVYMPPLSIFVYTALHTWTTISDLAVRPLVKHFVVVVIVQVCSMFF